MYVEKLTLANFRCFDRESLKFNWPEGINSAGTAGPRLPNINLLIGNNGTGKTTIFQALTVAVLRPYLATSASGFRTPTAIRYGRDMAESIADVLLSHLDSDMDIASDSAYPSDILASHHRATSAIKRKGTTQFLEMRGNAAKWADSLFAEKSAGFFVAAYGASRRTERREAYDERLRGVRYQRIASLFEPHVGLVPLSLAYLQCQERERWSEVVDIVNQLLRPPVRMTEAQTDDVEPLFDYEGISLPASELSDGYRLFIGWLIDCLTHIARVLPKHLKLTEAAGLVIVDEVDLFLAPVWQRTVLESLSSVFPKIQWLCSTHSPLVAGALESENIHILERTGPFTSRAYRPSAKFEGKSVDEILVELFDLHQPRSPQLERQLSDLADRAMNGDLEASLLYLRRLNEGSGQLK
ncbi:MAG: ATP-binding protein involved in virulence [Chthonomonadales bacterium]|nr:ATP-binding protein involved in virulence [Chthonomonadales bacterium]